MEEQRFLGLFSSSFDSKNHVLRSGAFLNPSHLSHFILRYLIFDRMKYREEQTKKTEREGIYLKSSSQQ